MFPIRATVIVRKKADQSILDLIELPSLDDLTVRNVIEELEARHGQEAEVDTSQIEMAKQACAA